MRFKRLTQLPWYAGWLWLGLGLLASATCIYDADARCGTERELVGKICVCKAGMTEQAGRCVVRDDSPASACDLDSDCGDQPNAVCYHVDAIAQLLHADWLHGRG